MKSKETEQMENIETRQTYDIEMQVSDTKELPKRSRYYQNMIDLQLIDKGRYYDELNRSYVIFICPFMHLEKAGISIRLKIFAKRTTEFHGR